MIVGGATAVGTVMASVVMFAGCARPVPVDPCAAGPGFAPWDQPGPDAVRPQTAADGAADALVVVYQQRLRRPELPGAGCRFHPTCSAFAREALGRYGVVGLLLAFDRLLIREQPFAGPSYPPACVDGEARWHDPVP